MSRHLEILRRAKLEGELFAAAGAGNGRPAARREIAWNAGQDRDQWQQLVHELFLRRGAQSRCALGLASATAGEGTSFVVSHLAKELARATEDPALLVDANVHHPAQAERCGVDPDPGLRHLLADRMFPLESCLRQTAVERLSLLPAGSCSGIHAAPDWTDFPRIFCRLRERFSNIIIDLPPVNASSDAMIIGPLFDGLVLVVEADLCSREVIQNAVGKLRRANARLLGAILNKRKFFVPAPLYRRL
jgi:Mrp family chromosome partitioning ATPase